MESPVLQIATDPQFPVEETEGQSRTPGIMALSLGLSPRDPEPGRAGMAGPGIVQLECSMGS